MQCKALPTIRNCPTGSGSAVPVLCIHLNGDPAMLRLRDIMTREVVTVAPDLSVRDAMELLTSRHISGAPVLSNRKIVGVVSLTDLAELASGSPGVPTERNEPDDEAAI